MTVRDNLVILQTKTNHTVGFWVVRYFSIIDKLSMSSAKPTTKSKKRQYLPAEERRRLILEAARDVFSRQGLTGARTRELAQAAGINQATLFEHFKSKEELFLAAVIEPLEKLIEGAKERSDLYSKAKSPEELVERLQGGIETRLNRVIDIFPLLSQALFSDQELGKKLYTEKIQPLLKAQAAFVKGNINESIDPELFEIAIFGIFFAIAMDQFITGKERDVSKTSEQIIELLIHGCTTKS